MGEGRVPNDEIDRDANIFFGKDFCGDVSFSSTNKVSRMRFIPCFFDGQDRTLEDVVKQFVTQFGGRPETVFLREDEQLCKGSPIAYKGITDEGEHYEIYWAVIDIASCGAMVQITPGSGKAMKF